MWIQQWGPFLSFTYLLQTCAANFTFSHGDAEPCGNDDFMISWTGGTPPFEVSILPLDSVQRDIPIDDDSVVYKNNLGVTGFVLMVKADSEMVLIMSDSSGFGSGGVSPLIKVNGGVCRADDLRGPDYTFTTDQVLRQCEAFRFQDFDNATQPVQIHAVIPGGPAFLLEPPNGSHVFDWTVDVAAGTQIFFSMVDSQHRQGGTTSLMTVQQSGDSSCLERSSVATHPPSLTAASTSTSTQTGAGSASRSTSHMHTGTLIAAIVVPVVAAMALAIGAFIWYRRRRRNGGVRLLGPHKPRQPVVDLMKGDPDTPPHMEEVGSPTTASTPFLHGRSPSAEGETTLARVSSLPHTSATTSQSGGASSASASGGQPDGQSGARRKAAEAAVLAPPGHQPATRFILHTDIEDTVPPSPVEEVVELPPQYSERRGAGPAASGTDSQPEAGEPSVPQP